MGDFQSLRQGSSPCTRTMSKRMTFYSIYSLAPTEDGEDDYRLVEMFEREEDAELVLAALEKVNFSFNCYRIQEMHVDF
jgi:hypothetical protein